MWVEFGVFSHLAARVFLRVLGFHLYMNLNVGSILVAAFTTGMVILIKCVTIFIIIIIVIIIIVIIVIIMEHFPYYFQLSRGE